MSRESRLSSRQPKRWDDTIFERVPELHIFADSPPIQLTPDLLTDHEFNNRFVFSILTQEFIKIYSLSRSERQYRRERRLSWGLTALHSESKTQFITKWTQKSISYCIGCQWLGECVDWQWRRSPCNQPEVRPESIDTTSAANTIDASCAANCGMEMTLARAHSRAPESLRGTTLDTASHHTRRWLRILIFRQY